MASELILIEFTPFLYSTSFSLDIARSNNCERMILGCGKKQFKFSYVIINEINTLKANSICFLGHPKCQCKAMLETPIRTRARLIRSYVGIKDSHSLNNKLI